MIKINKHKFLGSLLLFTVVAVGVLLQSCEVHPHEYEVTSGVPTVDYIRITDPEKSDSLVVSAAINRTISLIGNNLTSIEELWFNDKQAYLNTSFMTSNSLIVSIPNLIPGVVSDKIYMRAGKDTLTYDFKVIVPPPVPQAMLCEFVADGEEAIIKGSYLIDDPNVPLEVIFPGGLAGEVISVSDSFDEVVVKVPSGAGIGPISVKSIYGSTRSSFFFRDDRNYILDWDTLNADGGWRPGIIDDSSPSGISGNYVRLNGDMVGAAGGGWNGDELSFNLWNSSNGRSEEPFYSGDLDSAVLKFECYVVENWSAAALQMIFTPFSVSGTNTYITDGVTPRGLWNPWAAPGSYITEGWTTVTVPMSEFKFLHDGTDAGSTVTTEMLGGLTFFAWHGGVEGQDCRVHLCIDNIRIVPM